jgi:cobalt-precorrin 5A hydrolase
MKTALVTLSDEGARLLAPLITCLPEARLFVHESVRNESIRCEPVRNETTTRQDLNRREADLHDPGRQDDSTRSDTELEAPAAERFARIADLTASLFPVCRGLVYAAPCGVVVRAIAPLIKSKHEDPAVVVLDAGGRWAVSLLSGHEGGANDLAIRVANLTGAEPVVTTTTEALKSVIVGIGCRRGTPAGLIVAAVREILAEAGIALEEVRLLASADVKVDEAGLLEAAETLGVPIRFIASEEIRVSLRKFSHSDFVAKKVNLPAVAEPAALLAGRRTRFICRKKTYNGITIALAREGFSWSESAPAGR